MLSLFKEEVVPPEVQDVRAIGRNLLASFLNKGAVPTWEAFIPELPVMDEGEKLNDIKSYFAALTGWPFLEEILSGGGTEFFFHSINSSQRLLLNGEKSAIKVPLDEEDWQLWLEIISTYFHQNWNVKLPFVSFYGELFGKKYRIGLVHGSISPLGTSKMVIRALAQSPHPLSSFGAKKTLKGIIKNKNNILVAGSTGSGKTSLLSSLIGEVDEDEHIIILEDTFEIHCPHPHQTRMLAGDTLETSLKAYLSYSLRLTPDRIILGEMRSHEAVPFLMAMNTGHKGLMGTIHASSGVDALYRTALLFTLYGGESRLEHEKVMELLCRNLEYVVFMENKKVKEIIKVLGSERGVAFFEKVFPEESGLF